MERVWLPAEKSTRVLITPIISLLQSTCTRASWNESHPNGPVCGSAVFPATVVQCTSFYPFYYPLVDDSQLPASRDTFSPLIWMSLKHRQQLWEWGPSASSPQPPNHSGFYLSISIYFLGFKGFPTLLLIIRLFHSFSSLTRLFPPSCWALNDFKGPHR